MSESGSTWMPRREGRLATPHQRIKIQPVVSRVRILDISFDSLALVAFQVHALCNCARASLAKVFSAFVSFLVFIGKGNNAIALLYPLRRQIGHENSQRGGKSDQSACNLPKVLFVQPCCYAYERA